MKKVSHSARAIGPHVQDVKRAIDLLETAIYRRFGISIRMGAEMEYVIRCNDALPDALRKNPFQIADAYVKNNGYEPSCERMQNQKDVFFPNDPYVAYSYRELHFGFPDYPCETVLSHEADYGPTQLLSEHDQLKRMSKLADTVRRVKHGLQRGDGGERWRAFREQYVNEVSFDSYVHTRDADSGKRNAFQYDFSLHGPHGALSEAQYDAMKPYMALATVDGMALLGQKPSCRERFAKSPCWMQDQLMTHEVRDDLMPPRDHAYHEYRILGAAADPHVAMLLLLVGIYRGLAAEKDRSWAPAKAKEALKMLGVEAFDEAPERLKAKDNVIRETLNELDPKRRLGDSIVRAEQKSISR